MTAAPRTLPDAPPAAEQAEAIAGEHIAWCRRHRIGLAQLSRALETDLRDWDAAHDAVARAWMGLQR